MDSSKVLRKIQLRLNMLLILIVVIPIQFIGGAQAQELKDFRSDGCSLFPDRSLMMQKDWCACCFEHDIAYWQGGTEAERLKADKALRDCVLKKTGNEKFAEAMYTGVRLGGSPYFYTWYRWGYGWNYGRRYKKLTKAEKQRVEQKLNEYFKNPPEHPCD